jgi:hypothetical protein
VADFLGLGTLADDEPSMDPEILKKLYRHARGKDGRRQMHENDPTFAKGWINLNSPTAAEIIAGFVPLDDVENLKQARRMAQANLESQSWNDVLGIESPPIKCRVRVHGNKWGLRFESAKPTLRGRELLNEELPPIPGDPPGSSPGSLPNPRPSGGAQPASPASPPTSPVNDSAAASSDRPVAADILRRAGMPA